MDQHHSLGKLRHQTVQEVVHIRPISSPARTGAQKPQPQVLAPSLRAGDKLPPPLCLSPGSNGWDAALSPDLRAKGAPRRPSRPSAQLAHRCSPPPRLRRPSCCRTITPAHPIGTSGLDMDKAPLQMRTLRSQPRGWPCPARTPSPAASERGGERSPHAHRCSLEVAAGRSLPLSFNGQCGTLSGQMGTGHRGAGWAPPGKACLWQDAPESPQLEGPARGGTPHPSLPRRDSHPSLGLAG